MKTPPQPPAGASGNNADAPDPRVQDALDRLRDRADSADDPEMAAHLRTAAARLADPGSAVPPSTSRN